ncbi:MAG: zinc ribbon domain-containing protein [Candidatus Bathyarchaeia archaeon]
MTIDDHLLSSERILASAKAPDAYRYATNERVIRYKKGLFGEKIDFLNYSNITGASYESYSYRWLIAVGIGLIIFGAFLSNIQNIGVAGTPLILVGVLIILVGLFSKPRAWYQIKALGLKENELKAWRIDGVENDSKTFARFIQDQIAAREKPNFPQVPPSVTKEVITKEIVMIKCDYCGLLMPQAAHFCPNCGARRNS